MPAMHRIPFFALLALPLAGCAELGVDGAPGALPIVTVERDPDADWSAYANDADEARIGQLDAAWAEGLGAASPRFATAIANEDALLDPDAALDRPAPTPGSYECRIVKLREAGADMPAFSAYPPFFCYVESEEGRFTMVKQTGTQRPAGRLYEASDDRLVFLGSVALDGEAQVPAYGDDAARDVIGVFERIGPFRWRLVMPYPRAGGVLDIIEFTPVAEQP